MRTVILILLISFLVATPALVLGSSHTGGGLTNPSGSLTGGQIVPCTGADDCDFGSLIALGQNILNFLVGLAIIISAIMFAYAGWLYFSDSGNQQNVQHAHKIFGHVVIGIILVLVAWLVVDTILSALTGRGFRDRQEINPQQSASLNRN